MRLILALVFPATHWGLIDKMPSIVKTTRGDIIWNYIGTIVSMSSGFILLPFLMHFLSSEELGLWYVLLALGNFAMLFEFGFNPTFARNIVYVISGARRLSAKGCDWDSVEDGVDWHLLNVVIKSSKVIYAIIALAVLLLLATAGTAYIAYVTAGMDPFTIWTAWGLFCAAIFLNLYFLWTSTVLRGYGDIAGQNKASTLGTVSKLLVSAVLLFLGFGVIGAAVGYLANAVVLRLASAYMLKKHRDIEAGRRSDRECVLRSDVKGVLLSIFQVAWRDGLVQLANYGSSQAMSILSSLFLGLAETGTYSVLLQLANAVCNFASTYPKSFYPAVQAAYAENDGDKQRHYISTGVVAYWGLMLFGTAGVCLVILPLLPIIKPSVVVDYALFLGLCAYLSLFQQHGIFCNYIISMNEIPYMVGFIVATALGTCLVGLMCGLFGMGAWGIVLGQALSQVVYNNWKWPMYLCEKLGFTYRACLRDGVAVWKTKLWGAARKSRA